MRATSTETWTTRETTALARSASEPIAASVRPHDLDPAVSFVQLRVGREEMNFSLATENLEALAATLADAVRASRRAVRRAARQGMVN